MATLDEYVAKARSLDETEFVSAFPHPFLFNEGGTSGSGSGTWTSADAPTQTTRAVAQKGGNGASAHHTVLVVRRSDSSKHPSIVTVGRAEDCDVRLAHPLVSKRHAYFTQSERGWCIADAESSNGTFADGERLEPHKLHPIADSEVLRFGPELKYRFFTPAAFYRYLSYRARMKT